MGTPVGGDGFATALLINFIVFLVILIVFNFMRRWTVTAKFYTPKRYFKIENRRKPKRLPALLWGWFLPLINGTYSEEDLYEIAGFDAVMYFKFLRMGLEMFTVITLWCFIVIAPVNSQGWVNKQKYDLTNSSALNPKWQTCLQNNGQDPNDPKETCRDKLFIISLSNIDINRKRLLWVHLVSVYVMSGFIYYLLYFYNKQAVKLRFKYLASSQQGAESRTVFITDIPEIPIGQPIFRVFQLINSKLLFIVPRSIRMKLEAKINYLIDKASGKVEQKEAKPYKKQDIERGSEEELFTDAKEDPLRSTGKGEGDKEKIGASDAPLNQDQGTSKKQQLKTIKQIMLKKESKSNDDFIKYGINTKLRARQKFFQGQNAQQVVDSEVRSAFPDGVVDDVHVVYDEEELSKIHAQYQKTKETLEDLLDLYTSYRRRGKKIKRTQVYVVPLVAGPWAVEKYGQAPLKTDSLEYNTELLAQLYDKLLEEQKISKDRATSSAFLTFKKRWYRTVATNSLFCQNELHWKMVGAPNPKEIEWGNLFMQNWERQIRSLVSWGIFTVMTIFYLVPVAGIQLVINYVKNLKAADFLFQNSIMNALVSGIIPQLGLIIFLGLVPVILAFLGRAEGMICQSQIDFSVIKKFYLFQIVIVFLTQLVSQNIIGTFQKAIESPLSIFNTLGGSAPQSGNYFANYIVTQALNTQTVGFMRVVGLVFFLLRTFMASTDRSKRKIWQNYRMSYANYTVSDMIALLLGLVYSLIQPIVLPMCFVYFLIANVIWRYNLLYVFREQYQSGGLLWPLLHDQVLIAVAIWQIIMVGYFILNQFAASALIVIPLVSTFAYYIFIARSYDRPVKTLSLMGAMQLDKDELMRNQSLVNQGKGDNIYEDYDYYYMSPCFKVSHDDHVRHLKEAINMDKLLKGTGQETQDEDEEQGQGDYTFQDSEDGPNEPDYYKDRDPNAAYQTIQQLDARLV